MKIKCDACGQWRLQEEMAFGGPGLPSGRWSICKVCKLQREKAACQNWRKKTMKSWTKSKTVWVNVVTLTVGIIGYVAGHDLIVEYPAVIAALIAVQGAANVALRFLTWQAVK